MPTISVVIPVYMTADYLPRCINSVLCQSYTDFELILVDDGSPDECGKICDEYAKKDSRIRVIHQTNSGVSAARNSGLEIATGMYVVFIDSDDWVDENYLLALSKAGADFVAHSFSTYSEEGSWIKKLDVKSDRLSTTTENVLSLLNEGILGYIVCKRFSMDIIRKYKIRFNTDINHTEDTLFVLDYLKYAKVIEAENEDHYHYIRYRTRSTLSGGATLDRLAMICTANRIICSKFFPKDSKEYEQLFYSRVGYGYMSYIDSVWLKNFKSPLQTYKFVSNLWLNEDISKILRYAPDAIWKLSFHDRIIRELQGRNRMRLLLSCIYASLSEGKKRYESQKN